MITLGENIDNRRYIRYEQLLFQTSIMQLSFYYIKLCFFLFCSSKLILTMKKKTFGPKEEPELPDEGDLLRWKMATTVL